LSTAATIVWFRYDLRLCDNPALDAAIQRGGPVLPLYIYVPEEEAPWQPGRASRHWLHHSLAALENDLAKTGSKLILRRGNTSDVFRALLRETNAKAVLWNRRYEPAILKRDETLAQTLKEIGIQIETFNSALLFEPWSIKTSTGGPFQVFTPFWRACLKAHEPAAPLPAPRRISGPAKWPPSLRLNELNLTSSPPPDISPVWQPGAAGAHAMLKLLGPKLGNYEEGRDVPGSDGTSRLSPHLHFGEISPREVWSALKDANSDGQRTSDWRQSRFLMELGWREFSHHLLYHFPTMPEEPIRGRFRNFRWRNRPEFLDAWAEGRTGYPFVDAGMRQLRTIGWMHNRVRMVAASFLVKHLLMDWREGARCFWERLVDADLAQNSMGWQWVAGCGADAAPFFRIFNPVLQGEKFDGEGSYIRRWVPELARLPKKWIHQPWKAPSSALKEAGVELGGTYPEPIVNHAIAREVALEAYKQS
jgi:deoxyribodipyrimidine photo-lyase